MKSKTKVLVIVLFFIASSALAQEEPALSLRLSRDLGTAFAGRVQGTFSMHVTGAEGLQRVEFFIDGDLIGEDREAPFRLQFRTDNYSPGNHVLSAIGYLPGPVELRSNSLNRGFLEPGETGRLTIVLVVVLLALTIGGRFLASRIADRGKVRSGEPAITGPLGGTICPNCGRPYALHLWSVNLVAGRVDRCPHCRSWRFVRRASLQALEQAAALIEESSAGQDATAPVDVEEDLRRRLDDSRFDDAQ